MQINLIDFLKQENAFLKKQVEHLNKQNEKLMEMLEMKPKKEKEEENNVLITTLDGDEVDCKSHPEVFMTMR